MIRWPDGPWVMLFWNDLCFCLYIGPLWIGHYRRATWTVACPKTKWVLKWLGW